MTKDAERVPPTLPEAVEQAIKEVVFAAHDTGLFASDKYVRFEGEQVNDLRAAILSYGAARERQGIERAKAGCCSASLMCGGHSNIRGRHLND